MGKQQLTGPQFTDSYEDIEFSLQLPSLDHVLDQILHLNNPKLVKADISRAFRNVPIDPRDAIKCGITFQNQFYVDKFLVFGAVNGTMIFQRISDAVRHMLRQEGMIVWNYIDDVFAAFEAEGSDSKFNNMCQLITDLGLPLNPKKVEPPSDIMTIMGIQIDILSKTVSIPGEKMAEIVEACESAGNKRCLCRRDLQSLLGKLLYVSKVIRPARGFLNRMLQCLRDMRSVSVLVEGDLQRDLTWFRKFVTSFNGTTTFANWAGSNDHEVYADASLMGLGGV